MSKIFLNFLTFFTLLLGTSVFSQSLPSSSGTVRCHTCTPNGNWVNIKGTPDVSDRNIVAATGTIGGGTAWTAASLPLPPNNHQYWITIRDTGDPASEEIIGTTMAGLTVGLEYEVVVYSLTAFAPTYSPALIDAFDFEVEGVPKISVGSISENSWTTKRLRFTATKTSPTLRFYPGSNATVPNYESVNISVSLNAVNAVPIATNDNTYTAQGVPVSINVTSNDSDSDGAIVVSTVDLNPSSPGIQNSITTAQGTWTVNSSGVVTFTSAVGFYGLATIPYTIQDNFVLDGVSAPSTSAPANISILVQAPFASCSEVMYLTQYTAGSSGVTTLYSLNNLTNPLTTTPIGSVSDTGIKINAIGYNPIDNFIYGINAVDDHLFRMDAHFTLVDLGAVTGLLNTSGDYLSGDIDDSGNYYVKENSAPNTSLYKINIATKTATLIPLSSPLQTADFAYSKADGLLYGVNQIPGANFDKLYGINPVSGQVSFSSGPTGVGSQFGAMYTDGITGAIYGNSNSDATFYRFNKTTGLATKVSASISASGNDGAHCVNARIQFGVDLEVTKTDGKTKYIPGTTNTYTVVVSNAGPFTALNAVVTDLVPTGIPATNVSYTAVASTGSTTSVVGTLTGAINDVVNIQKDGTVTYTIVLDVPITYTGNLVNTATVVVSADNVEVNLTNNSATDTDIQEVCYNDPNTGTGVSTNHGITLLKRAGADNGNWPMVRQSAHTVLESNTKGFVITRMTTAQINAIVSPQEGMMVYDTELKCLKINSNSTTGGWSCFNTPACP